MQEPLISYLSKAREGISPPLEVRAADVCWIRGEYGRVQIEYRPGLLNKIKIKQTRKQKRKDKTWAITHFNDPDFTSLPEARAIQRRMAHYDKQPLSVGTLPADANSVEVDGHRIFSEISDAKGEVPGLRGWAYFAVNDERILINLQRLRSIRAKKKSNGIELSFKFSGTLARLTCVCPLEIANWLGTKHKSAPVIPAVLL